MTGDTHYDLEVLAELAEGLLDAGTACQVRDHLAVCDPCGELLADLAAVREVLAATPTPAMPMGVALRIDKALAAEAEQRRGGVDLAEAPDWDELMRDAPWQRPAEVSEPARLMPAARIAPETVPAEPVQAEEPVRLGVVADDGTIVPARRRVARRRRWALPAVAAAAAAVVGGVVVSGNLLVAGGDGGTGVSGQVAAQPQPSSPSRQPQLKPRPYALTQSDHNYSDEELRQPLERFLGPAPIVAGPETNTVASCVDRVADRTRLKVFAVDQGQYNGQEAVIVASWKDEAAKRVRLDVVDPYHCKNLRKPRLGRW
ncbi:hypothetical protein [Nonomuraea rhodomycinica]|uniref:Zinc-finger n=1 Tax=Nonomuraea rhodomycinica TaxID=1712872 RepID=A0A7Y6IUV7_9ACTN|nr:hypothetical protein [Nonomuraea rhodomycinica]NUW44565.1 hypothetical protein [Nonomuraea rhodomycinica]